MSVAAASNYTQLDNMYLLFHERFPDLVQPSEINQTGPLWKLAELKAEQPTTAMNTNLNQIWENACESAQTKLHISVKPTIKNKIWQRVQKDIPASISSYMALCIYSKIIKNNFTESEAESLLSADIPQIMENKYFNNSRASMPEINKLMLEFLRGLGAGMIEPAIIKEVGQELAREAEQEPQGN